MSERKWAETGERVCNLQCLRIFAQEPNLSSMGAHSLGRVRPEGIKVRPNGQAIKRVVLDVAHHQVTTPNVLALTVRALERAAQMVTGSCLTIPDLILHLCQGCSVEVPRDRCSKAIQMVWDEAISTPRPRASREPPAGVAKVCANNP